MRNKIIKLVTLIFLISIMFNINTKGVNAETCSYATPLSFIDQYDRATNLQVSLNYNHYFNPPGPVLTAVVSMNEVLPVDKFYATLEKKTATFGFHTSTKLEDTRELTGIIQDEFYFDDLKFSLKDVNGCPKFIKIADKNATEASEEEYKKYIKSNQYKGYTKDDSKLLYNLITIYDLNEKEIQTARKYAQSVEPLVDKKDNFLNYIKNTGGIVLVNTETAPSYPTKALDRYNEILDYGNYDEEKKKDALTGLNAIIDAGTIDNKTYTEMFYEGTKDRWYKYMQSDLKDPKKADVTRKTYFSRWWNLVSRYEFEYDYSHNNMSRFKEFVNYICDNPDSIENFDSKTCKSTLEIIDGMESFDKAENDKTSLSNNKCKALCPSCMSTNSSNNSNACIACENGESYKTCNNCLKKCSSIGSASAKDSCEKQCMGENLYTEFNNSYSNYASELEEEMQNASEQLYNSSVTLKKAKAPTLNVSFDRYEVQCDDVSFLHKIYVILRIIAPILVVLFGTIDFAKAVVAGDEKKMQESRKKFPKRLILLLLFILVPIIIEIMIDLFSVSDTSIMRCVIKGA